MILKASQQRIKVAAVEINCLPVWVIENTSISEPNKTKRKCNMNRLCYAYIPAYNSFTCKLSACCWNISESPVNRICRILLLVSIHVDLPRHSIFWENEIAKKQIWWNIPKYMSWTQFIPSWIW